MREHLDRLECDEYSSIDDIKKQYRLLSKRYHPDLNGNATAALFIELTKSYDHLIAHHKPRKRLEQVPADAVRLYRVLEKKPYRIEIEKETPRDKGIVIFCMVDMIEFRLKIDKDLELPTTVRVSNVTRVPFDIDIVLR